MLNRRFAPIAGCLLVLAAAACSGDPDASTPSPAPTRPPATAASTARPAPTATAAAISCGAAADLPPVYCADTSAMQGAQVVRIIDGDTLDVTLDGAVERVRIFGIDTPERGDRCFAEASALLEWLAGAEVRLRSDVRTVDRNGRLLRYVYRPDGLSIDAVMIAGGAAYAWTRDGALRDELVALEVQARLARTGCLWG